MTGSVAAMFAHPDDEVLACGASLAKHADAGDAVHVLILATGLTSRGEADKAAVEGLRRQARAAAAILGVTSIAFGDFPDNRMDTVPLLSVVQEVERFRAEVRPTLVYTHHGGDLNVDHRIVQQAVVTTFRPVPGTPPHEIRACEVNSSTEWSAAPLPPFEPTMFEPVDATLERKVEALACYADEMRDWPHPRSLDGVRALARWRGAQCGRNSAEAFALVRRVAE